VAFVGSADRDTAITALQSAPVISDSSFARFKGASAIKSRDRHLACGVAFSTMARVTQIIRVNGVGQVEPGLGASTPLSGLRQVLDFRISSNGLERYVQVLSETGRRLWVASQQVQLVDGESVGSIEARYAPVPRIGSRVRITSQNGINHRSTPGGTWMGRLGLGQEVLVRGVVIRGPENQVHLQVFSGRREGYIYSGRLAPTSTLPRWTKTELP
jgi:hypothetical protein